MEDAENECNILESILPFPPIIICTLSTSPITLVHPEDYLCVYLNNDTVYIQIFMGCYFCKFCESVKVREIKIAKILTISQGNMHVGKALNG